MKLKIFVSIVALLLTALIYIQGLGGLFMLDDVANLQSLYDQIKEQGFWSGILSGNSGPTGRPVSLWTFALQQSSWPADPASFKLVNIVIHLINSLLMAVIIYWLLPYLVSNLKEKRFFIAILLSAFWALLPIQISTVLYVVQRMVLLSSMFMLLAIVFYIWARLEIARNKFIRAAIIFGFGVGGASLLAILSKESGLLVFAFILTIEVLVQERQPLPNKNLRRLLMFLLAIPLILFVVYIIYNGNYNHYSGRTFNLTERVLTQPRILLDYLHQIVLPSQSALGLYHDDYLKSTGLTSPISTLWSILFWIVFGGLALWGKLSNKPWLFFAFFWFISGHLMESTVLPLELYFEHRNYLSSAGILIGILGFCIALQPLIKSEAIKNWAVVGIGLYLCLILSISYSHTSLWGDKGSYMVVSAKENPKSLRARMLMIDYYDAIGRHDQAYAEIDRMLVDFPQEISLQLNKILYACNNGFDINNIKVESDLLQQGRFSNATENILLKLLEKRKQQECVDLTYDRLLGITYGLADNNNYLHVKERYLRIIAATYFQKGDFQKFIDFFDKIRTKSFADNMALIMAYTYTGRDKEAQELKEKLINSKDLTDFERKQMSDSFK